MFFLTTKPSRRNHPLLSMQENAGFCKFSIGFNFYDVTFYTNTLKKNSMVLHEVVSSDREVCELWCRTGWRWAQVVICDRRTWAREGLQDGSETSCDGRTKDRRQRFTWSDQDGQDWKQVHKRDRSCLETKLRWFGRVQSRKKREKSHGCNEGCLVRWRKMICCLTGQDDILYTVCGLIAI